MKKNINHQFFFPQAPEAVWEYLTNPELMELWLMKSDFKPVTGHNFQFRCHPIPSLDFDGIVYCKVLEITPFQKLSYTWKLGPGDGTITIDSVVEWHLKPKDKGTELTLNHGNFAILENLSIINAMDEGWLKNIQKIADRLNEVNHGTIKS